MKILFHTSYYQRMAGANRSFLELIKNLDKNKYTTLTVFTNKGPVYHYYQEQGLDVAVYTAPHTLNMHGKKLLKLNLFNVLRVVFFELLPFTCRFAMYLRNEKIDLVHVRDVRSLLLIGVASRLAGKPVFCHIRGELPSALLLSAFIGIVSTKIVTVNRVLINALPKRYRRKCELVYNSISESSFHELPSGKDMLLPLQKGKVHVSMFAVISKGKGIDILIKAVELLEERGGRAIFHVIGDTNYSPGYIQEMNSIITSRGLPIQFEGWCDDPRKWYWNSDIIVLPTRSEGFPRTLLEAMYFGKSVVATRVGGIPEMVVDEETGFLFDVDDIEQFSQQLHILINDHQIMKKMGAAGKDRVEKFFSTKIMIEKMQTLYDACKR